MEEVLTFRGSADGPWARYVERPDARGLGTVRYPRRVPADDGAAKELARRTLTNLYNKPPAWLTERRTAGWMRPCPPPTAGRPS